MFNYKERPPYVTDEVESSELNGVEMTMRANYFLGQLEEVGFEDTDWINWPDAIDAAKIHQKGLTERIKEHNGKYEEDTEGVITFPNEALAVLWCEEILGQISDGEWEGRKVNWKRFWNLRVEINEESDDVVVDADLFPLNFLERLTEWEGLKARLIFLVRASGVEEDYDELKLTSDLANLSSWERVVTT